MDYRRFYEKVSALWRQRTSGRHLLMWLDRLLVAVVAGGYGVTLVWLVAAGDARWMRVAAVPAVLLVLASALRAWLNRPRPYEAFDIEPLLAADTAGKSLPSRHVACAFVIACALGYVEGAWGVGMALAACLVAYTRVAGGVHFPRDVAAGAALGLACGALGFLAIP